mmetsp:Transcript_97555/g.187066  ORF Transcript_97555/g.187066 Transcript_97555/m.187066 type:complete len:117 (-) Transcript_97555:33-383(-)
MKAIKCVAFDARAHHGRMHCAPPADNDDAQIPQSQFQPATGQVANGTPSMLAQSASLVHLYCVQRPKAMLIGFVMPAVLQPSSQMQVFWWKLKLPEPHSWMPHPLPSGRWITEYGN